MHCYCKGLFHEPTCPMYIPPEPWPNPAIGGVLTKESMLLGLYEMEFGNVTYNSTRQAMQEIYLHYVREIDDRTMWIEGLAEKWGLVRCGDLTA